MKAKNTLAEYKCRKALITQPDGSTVEIYYTKDLGKIRHKEYQKLDGFPLQYTSTANGMSTRITATSVEDEKLDDSLFTVPEGYTEMTLEELQGFGG